MQNAAISRILGLLLLLLSITFIPPMGIAWWYDEACLESFQLSFGLTFLSGFLLWRLFSSAHENLRTHDGFFLVVLFWTTTSLISALPLYLALMPTLSLTDAFFESVSGITTTGATIFSQLDTLPRALLYYRQQLQFLGGISIIILAVAILPTLSIGGMQLFRTEITGPVKDNKVLPRITESAKAIWLVYVGITILCAISYWVAGMSGFDAIAHSFSTVSTGGFSTHDASLGHYHSASVQLVATIFMLLGAINFNLHFLVFRSMKTLAYRQDPELLFFLKLFVFIALVIWVTLILHTPGSHLVEHTVSALFETASFLSTTGFSAAPLMAWPFFLPVLLLFLGIIGGCAGSTSGGIKSIRALLLYKQAALEIRRLVHPHGQYVVKFGHLALSGKIIEAIWSFFAIYFVTFLFLLLLLLIFETDFFTAYTALIAALSNAGRGLGLVSENFAHLSHAAKWILSIAMLLGRLEIFTVLVLLSPAFWRR